MTHTQSTISYMYVTSKTGSIVLSLVWIVLVMLRDLSQGLVVVVSIHVTNATGTPIARDIFENESLFGVRHGMKKRGLRGNTKTNSAKKTRDMSALKSMQKPIRSQLRVVGLNLPTGKPSRDFHIQSCQNSMSGQLSKPL